MLSLSSSDFANHDLCQRLRTWDSQFAPFRISLHRALHDALREGLVFADPTKAHQRLIQIATKPGIEITAKSNYDAVIHHASLVELLTQYLMSAGPVDPIGPIDTEWGDFIPESLLLPDGRLWRPILTDRWGKDRELAEKMSWRSMADCAVTNRPMLITVLVIGSTREGFRPSRWTLGYQHPSNHTLRILKRDGEEFGAQWKRVYREHTDLAPLEWLKAMQADRAFDSMVYSMTAHPIPTLLAEMSTMASEMKSSSLRQTRSSCFRFTPCQFLPACAQGQSPSQMGWIERDSLDNPARVMLPVITQ